MQTMFYQPELVPPPLCNGDPFSAELMLDINYLENLDAEETRMMEHLAMVYLPESKQLFEKLGRALERGAYKEANTTLELLLGASAICNIQSIVPGLRQLGQAIREGNFAGTRFLYQTCGGRLDRVRRFLRSYISS